MKIAGVLFILASGFVSYCMWFPFRTFIFAQIPSGSYQGLLKLISLILICGVSLFGLPIVLFLFWCVFFVKEVTKTDIQPVSSKEVSQFAKTLLLQNYKINVDDYSIGEISDMMNLLTFVALGYKNREDGGKR